MRALKLWLIEAKVKWMKFLPPSGKKQLGILERGANKIIKSKKDGITNYEHPLSIQYLIFLINLRMRELIWINSVIHYGRRCWLFYYKWYYSIYV